jgi:hypothetical protein
MEFGRVHLAEYLPLSNLAIMQKIWSNIRDLLISGLIFLIPHSSLVNDAGKNLAVADRDQRKDCCIFWVDIRGQHSWSDHCNGTGHPVVLPALRLSGQVNGICTGEQMSRPKNGIKHPMYAVTATWTCKDWRPKKREVPAWKSAVLAESNGCLKPGILVKKTAFGIGNIFSAGQHAYRQFLTYFFSSTSTTLLKSAAALITFLKFSSLDSG